MTNEKFAADNGHNPPPIPYNDYVDKNIEPKNPDFVTDDNCTYTPESYEEKNPKFD